MKYSQIDNTLFIKNRKNFAKKLDANSVAIFNSNDIYPIGADSTFPFEQHRDIFYLTGIDQEETILLLSPQAKEIKNREILFVKKTNIKSFCLSAQYIVPVKPVWPKLFLESLGWG